MPEPTHLAVGVLKKPHGVKGDVLIHPMTDAPERVFVEGRQLEVLDGEGRPTGGRLTISRARAYQRAWLVHFEGLDDRSHLERMRERYLGIAIGDARPLAEGEYFLHELVGLAVVTKAKEPVGAVREILEVPQGLLLSVAREAKSDLLVPFRAGIVRRVDRGARTIVIDPPAGLLDL